MEVTGEVLFAGTACGPLLKLAAPISFWGGVDPDTGTIIDVRHPDHGRSITGTILGLPGTIGSSSSSSVLLELIYKAKAPAALLLTDPDAILLIGLLISHEMGWAGLPALRLLTVNFASLPQGIYCLSRDGRLTLET